VPHTPYPGRPPWPTARPALADRSGRPPALPWPTALADRLPCRPTWRVSAGLG